MSGKFNGCAAKVRELYPEAIYVHCANHNLNLAITHACKIPSIRNCIGTIKELVNLFRLSNKAGIVLKKYIKAPCESAKQTRLLKFCETRWVEHLNSLSLFHDVYEHVCSRAVAKNFLWGGFSSIDRNFIEDITIVNYIE